MHRGCDHVFDSNQRPFQVSGMIQKTLGQTPGPDLENISTYVSIIWFNLQGKHLCERSLRHGPLSTGVLRQRLSRCDIRCADRRLRHATDSAGMVTSASGFYTPKPITDLQLQPHGMNYVLTFTTNFHPHFMTKVDRAYNVRCFYAYIDKTVNTDMEVR